MALQIITADQRLAEKKATRSWCVGKVVWVKPHSPEH